MIEKQTNEQGDMGGIREMLSGSGYSDKAIDYYTRKPHMGILTDADFNSEMTGTCGDTMGITLKVENGTIVDAKYQVMGCAGAVASAMAAVDLIKGKSLEYARNIDDGTIFRVLEQIPAKKHHCIQLAVKTLHKAIDEYRNGGSQTNQ
jgi:nitrogen fixation NifU-like protein